MNDCSEYENLKKAILYRAKYRGTRENDFLLFDFINFVFKEEIDHSELAELNEFILMDDVKILDLIKDHKTCNGRNRIEKIFVNFYKSQL